MKLYDPKCEEWALCFLQDFPLLSNAQRRIYAAELASEIQVSIEDWISATRLEDASPVTEKAAVHESK